MRKPLRFLLIAIGLILMAVVVAFTYQVYRTSRSEAVLNKIDDLVHSAPSEQTELEWAVLVYWLHNYHCASMPQTRASLSWLDDTERYVDSSMVTGPTVITVEALWTRYSELMGDAERDWYDMKRERDLVYNEVVKEGKAYFDARSYLDFARSQQRRQNNGLDAE
jgi:hypothetical protein